MFRNQLSHRILRQSPSRVAVIRPSSAPFRFQPLSTTAQLRARKDSQDKDSLKPRSSEYSQTGGDDAAAESPDAAFNPDKTRPEQEQKTAEQESGGGGSPLNVSPGNKDVSKARKEDEGGAQGSPRTSSSGGGSAPKSGGGQSG